MAISIHASKTIGALRCSLKDESEGSVLCCEAVYCSVEGTPWAAAMRNHLTAVALHLSYPGDCASCHPALTLIAQIHSCQHRSMAPFMHATMCECGSVTCRTHIQGSHLQLPERDILA